MSRIHYMFFDTESNDVFDYDIAADKQDVRLAEIDMLYTDEHLNQIGNFHQYVKPVDWQMKPKATEANGLVDEFLNEVGKPIEYVLNQWERVIGAGAIAVAYNAQHDCKIMRAELRRANRDDLFHHTRQLCVMRWVSPICGLKQIDKKTGQLTNKPKWASLTEAAEILDIETAYGLVGARRDNQIQLEIFRELKTRGHIPPTAKVHLRKGGPL